MFKGSLFITTDINTAIQSSVSSRVIIIGEPSQDVISRTNAIVASILLPPYSAMIAQTDNNMQEFYNQYYMHLYTKEPQEFIATVFKALILGSNILLYCNPDEFNLCGKFFLDFLNRDFGVIVGTQNNQFYFNPEYTGTVCTLLYLSDVLTSEELFMLYPENLPINNIILPKLVQELQPYVESQTTECYLKYFNDLNHRVKQNKKFMKSPISMRV